MQLSSGELTVWRGKNAAPPGNMPEMQYAAVLRDYYGDRTVGINRYYTALRQGDRTDLLVRTNRTYILRAGTDLVTLWPYDHEDPGVYKITQIQKTADEDGLPVTDLALERDEGIDANEFNQGIDGDL